MKGRRYDPVKRCLDLAVGVMALVLLAPLMLGVAATILLTMGRPVLFRQVRPGRAGRLFTLTKFRTMRVTGAELGPSADGERLTRTGRWLRATSLDELPTLWNVVCGHMSLVGPRPLLVQYLDRYTPLQARRHEVRPGLTGLAQVRGRNGLTWEQKFAYDVCYVGQRSLSLDLRLLTETIGAVVRARGIHAAGHATTPEFVGEGQRANNPGVTTKIPLIIDPVAMDGSPKRR